MKSESVIRSLKLLFYTAFIVQATLFVSFAFKWIYISPYASNIPIAVESWALLLTLFGIPGALKLFSVIMNKNKNTEDERFTTTLYKKAFMARFGILFLVATLNIILYAFSFKQNYMLLTLITFTAYIFSYPSVNYLKVNKKEEKATEE